MYIVILGCGRVGSRLANVLNLEGHEVAVIDKDPKAFKKLGKAFKGKTIEGIGFDVDVLREAGIEKADAFIAVTSGDNSNVVGSLVAKDQFRVPKVIARIYDPQRARIYESMGIHAVSSVAWAANKIKSMIAHAEVVRLMSFGNGEVEIVEAEVSPSLAGKQVDDLFVPGEIECISIIRFGRSFVPTRGTVLQLKDGIAFAVHTSAIPRLKRLLGIT